MGHYQLITGYDDARQRFTAQDSYQGGPNLKVPYDQMVKYWQHFNYTYLIIYPREFESKVHSLLGPHVDETYNLQYAAQVASDEIYSFTGRAQYFAWFNRGANLRLLQDYVGAAAAFDSAFELYANLDPETRPWRMMWYRTDPYWAYFYSARYYDVISLATETLSIVSELEESYYWRALAKEAIGDVSGAVADLRSSLKHHPDWGPAMAQLERLGATP
jgi:tetratricopeptide (TPR) repeat protein